MPNQNKQNRKKDLLFHNIWAATNNYLLFCLQIPANSDHHTHINPKVLSSNVLIVWPTVQNQRYSIYNYIKTEKKEKIQIIKPNQVLFDIFAWKMT